MWGGKATSREAASSYIMLVGKLTIRKFFRDKEICERVS